MENFARVRPPGASASRFSGRLRQNFFLRVALGIIVVFAIGILTACNRAQSSSLGASGTILVTRIYDTGSDGRITFAGENELVLSNVGSKTIRLSNPSPQYGFTDGGGVTVDAPFEEALKKLPVELKPGEKLALRWKGGGVIAEKKTYEMRFELQVDGEARRVTAPVSVTRVTAPKW